MKVVVVPTRCQGHARCHTALPAVFELDEIGHAVVRVADVAPELEDLARRAVMNCPERAISLQFSN